MPSAKQDLIDQETRFDLEELFFTTTDLTGKIRSCNDVFERVSGYPLSEMIGKPHSLVRHPDVPRAIFHLLWEYLEAGKPIGAYVKNRSANGAYYWVFAMAMPIPGQDGYLSVRLKPTSKEIFPAVQEAYRKLLAIEESHEARGDRKAGLDASVAELPNILKELGFGSYDAFTSVAFQKELELRSSGLKKSAESTGSERGHGRPVVTGTQTSLSTVANIQNLCKSVEYLLDRQFAQLDGFITLGRTLDEKSRFVRGLARTVRLVSLNAMAASGRLSTSGAPLGVIARAIGAQAEESGQLAIVLEEHNAKAAAALNHTGFLLSIAKLQMEMVLLLAGDLVKRHENTLGTDASGTGQAESDFSLDNLLSIVACLTEIVRQFFGSYGGVIKELTPLMAELTDLRQLVQTLDITHVTGMVESGRLPEAKGFDALFNQVGEQVNFARDELQEFADSVHGTIKDIAALAEVESKVVGDLTQVTSVGDKLKLAS